MLCPKCNVQSEESFCRKCGLDLGVYEELAALKKQLESLQVRLLAPADVPYRAATQAGDGKKEAGSELAKPPPLPPGPAQGEPKDFAPARKSGELAVGQKWFLGIGVLVLIIGIGFFLKYAFDQEGLGPAVQIAVGFVCGACLLFTGGVCHRRGIRGPGCGHRRVRSWNALSFELRGFAGSSFVAGCARTRGDSHRDLGRQLSFMFMDVSVACRSYFFGSFSRPAAVCL